MKKTGIIIVFTLILAVNSCFSQRDSLLLSSNIPVNYTLLKSNLLPILWGSVPLSAEYRVVFETVTSRRQSLQIGVSFLGKSPFVSWIEKYSSPNPDIKIMIRGFRFQAAYKFFFLQNYMNTKTPFGFYAAPFYSYSTARITDRYSNIYDDYLRAVYINYDIILGYQDRLFNILVIDMFGGLGYRDNTWLEHFDGKQNLIDDLNFSPYSGHLKIIAGFNVGYVF